MNLYAAASSLPACFYNNKLIMMVELSLSTMNEVFFCSFIFNNSYFMCLRTFSMSNFNLDAFSWSYRAK